MTEMLHCWLCCRKLIRVRGELLFDELAVGDETHRVHIVCKRTATGISIAAAEARRGAYLNFASAPERARSAGRAAKKTSPWGRTPMVSTTKNWAAHRAVQSTRKSPKDL